MNKPTDTTEMYPATRAMLDALEDQALKLKIRAVSRLITALIATATVLMCWYHYPKIAWLFKAY
jgi:hypothetical protein